MKLAILLFGALAVFTSASASASASTSDTMTLSVPLAAVPFKPLLLVDAPAPAAPPAAAPPRSKARPAPSAGGARPAWGPQLRSFDQR